MNEHLIYVAGLVLFALPFVFAYLKTPARAEGGTLPPLPAGAIPVKLSDGGQHFQVFCSCPKCGLYALHHMDEPNQEPPNVLDDWNEVIVSWGGETIRDIPPRQDRPDEREWAVARVCRCGHRFGQL